MSIDDAIQKMTDLIKAAQETVVDETKIREMRERARLAEEQFEKESKARSVNAEVLARSYSM